MTAFLACWVYEELWHGEAIGQVLEAHGETAGTRRIAALRQRPPLAGPLESFTHFACSTSPASRSSPST